MPGLDLFALRAADGATVTLERFPIVLGRTVAGGSVPDVDVSHLDLGGTVENRHCELLPEVGGVLVRDLGAASGTLVEGRRLPPGGRAVLRVGETLSVGGVLLALVSAPGRGSAAESQPELDEEPLEDGGEWREPGLGTGVPPPPSARDRAEFPSPPPAPPVIHLPAAPPPRAGLDLTGAPPLVRLRLEQGADAVRLTSGLPLMSRRDGRWSSEDGPLSEGDLADAVRTLRRGLGLGEEPPSGWGYVGDLAVDFGVPPLVARSFAGAALATAGPVPTQLLARIEETVSAGGCLLVAARHPELALGQIAERLGRTCRRPRVLSGQPAGGWTPPAWPVLDCASELGREEALRGDPLVAIDPPGPVLEALLGALPRRLGGTVLALEGASAAAALEECARFQHADLGSPLTSWQARRSVVARHLDLVLTTGDPGWRLLRLGLGTGERWALEELLGAEGD